MKCALWNRPCLSQYLANVRATLKCVFFCPCNMPFPVFPICTCVLQNFGYVFGNSKVLFLMGSDEETVKPKDLKEAQMSRIFRMK